MTRPLFALFFNPSAQTRKANKKKYRLEWLLERNDVNFRFIETIPDNTSDLVADILKEGKYDHIGVMGGDGSIHDIANGIMKADVGKDVVLHIIPAGTGNDIAKSFGLSPKNKYLEDNVALFRTDFGRVSDLDVGFFKTIDENGHPYERYFLDAVSMDGDAMVLDERYKQREIAEQLPWIKHIWRDKVLYGTAAAATFLASLLKIREPAQAWLVVDGEEQYFDQLRNVVINNTPVYGSHFEFSDSTSFTDGELDVVTFRNNWEWFLKAAIAGQPIFNKNLLYRGSFVPKVIGGKRIHLEYDRPVMSQVDGEKAPRSKTYEISIKPSAMQVKLFPRLYGMS